MNEKHFEILKEIIKVYLPEDVAVDDITPESDLIEQLNINSANMVDIVLDIEDKFDIALENDDMHKMQTVKDVVKIVEQKLEEK